MDTDSLSMSVQGKGTEGIRKEKIGIDKVIEQLASTGRRDNLFLNGKIFTANPNSTIKVRKKDSQNGSAVKSKPAVATPAHSAHSCNANRPLHTSRTGSPNTAASTNTMRQGIANGKHERSYQRPTSSHSDTRGGTADLHTDRSAYSHNHSNYIPRGGGSDSRSYSPYYSPQDRYSDRDREQEAYLDRSRDFSLLGVVDYPYPSSRHSQDTGGRPPITPSSYYTNVYPGSSQHPPSHIRPQSASSMSTMRTRQTPNSIDRHRSSDRVQRSATSSRGGSGVRPSSAPPASDRTSSRHAKA